MKTYLVGGAVRDRLLGLAVQDRDFVVVGSSPDAMIAAGFLPVGRDFPVFLHPNTKEEYALARTERKTAQGYHGFDFYTSPEVTLEEDLARRDLTINAMAQTTQGHLIDPFNGQADLKAGLLRHVSVAFAEDPVRILRVARFAARFGFHVAAETQDLMKNMVQAGEVTALVAERVWQETAKALMEKTPSRFFYVLHECGALKGLFPEIEALFGVPQPPKHHPEIDCGIHCLMVLDQAARKGLSLAGRFAALCHDLGKGNTPASILPRHIGHEARGIPLTKALCDRLKVPSACRELALLAVEFHTHIHRAMELRPDTLLKFLIRTDALRRPERFQTLLKVSEADSQGRLGFESNPYPQVAYLEICRQVVAQVDAAEVAHQFPHEMPEALTRARLAALKSWVLHYTE